MTDSYDEEKQRIAEEAKGMASSSPTDEITSLHPLSTPMQPPLSATPSGAHEIDEHSHVDPWKRMQQVQEEKQIMSDQLRGVIDKLSKENEELKLALRKRQSGFAAVAGTILSGIIGDDEADDEPPAPPEELGPPPAIVSAFVEGYGCIRKNIFGWANNPAETTKTANAGSSASGSGDDDLLCEIPQPPSLKPPPVLEVPISPMSGLEASETSLRTVVEEDRTDFTRDGLAIQSVAANGLLPQEDVKSTCAEKPVAQKREEAAPSAPAENHFQNGHDVAGDIQQPTNDTHSESGRVIM